MENVSKIGNCVESLMPKGVEHSFSNPNLWALRCVESLMPKGVEHTTGQNNPLSTDVVSNL